MLLRLVIQNFLSFDDVMQFDMFPNMKRTSLSNHVYTKDTDVPLLKQAAVYGQNGAGKSNLVKALEFIKSFALDKNFLKSIELDKFFYRLKENYMETPICLAIEFSHGGKYYFYEMEIGNKSVIREALSETFPKSGQIEPVYERKKGKVEYADKVEVDDVIRSATEVLLKKNPLSSLLSLNREFPILQDPRATAAYRWFNGNLEIIGVHTLLPTLIEMLRKDTQMMEFARRLIAGLEVGVQDFNLTDEDFEQWAQKHIQLASMLPVNLEKGEHLALHADNTPVLSINIENGIKKVYQLIFDNIGKNGFIGHLDARAQSDGTLRALTLLPALYMASRQRKTVVVDEINFCLSPTMVKGIVSFFAHTEDTNGQLIFTTHDTQLLDEKDVLRSDEVWFIDKKEGASVLYCHNDFKEHHTISMMRGYNEGRYGAIRFVNLMDTHEKKQ